MYSRGIKQLASLLHTLAALADETLATAVVLGAYEILDGSSGRSWISHARGIRKLICVCGPSAHKNGMDQTLLLCWRPYLVADAFVHSEPCFLGGLEWTSIIKDITKVEYQQGRRSLLGQTMDSAFNEVAKCPGYCAIMTSDTNSSLDMLGSLVNSILKSRECLV